MSHTETIIGKGEMLFLGFQRVRPIRAVVMCNRKYKDSGFGALVI